jgi:hypothetical protein
MTKKIGQRLQGHPFPETSVAAGDIHDLKFLLAMEGNSAVLQA